ncbi:MAG: peptidoglycan bridge formation glycyltransferase FemA/FemB family protein [Chloroflexota bacterium]|nr:peptidoglycan bridge formation glycyltransferase FemA/FemB family protein [Chloroflexota bacterium]
MSSSLAHVEQGSLLERGITGAIYSHNKQSWDEAIAGAGLLQSWQWGEFKRQAGWTPLRLTVPQSTKDDNRDSEAGARISAQLLFRSVPRLPLPLSVAYIPRGPVYKAANWAAEKEFWRAIHREARKRGAIFLKVEPDIPLSGKESKASVDRKMKALRFLPAGRLQPARTIVLDLNRPEDEILKAMKPKTRYNLRLAARRGVAVRPAGSSDDIQLFYKLLHETGERDEFGIHTLDYYQEMWRQFGPQGDNSAVVLLAEHPNQEERADGPIAGLMALGFGREAIYMYGASANTGREHMPTYLLQWEAIKWAKARGCAVYDFWGIPDAPPDDMAEAADAFSPTNTRSGLRGVYWFKKGFGGREIEYPGAYDYVYNRVLYKLWMRWRGANLG